MDDLQSSNQRQDCDTVNFVHKACTFHAILDSAQKQSWGDLS